MTDPRIDTLLPSAILTDTSLRLAFAPLDKDAKVVAMRLDVGKLKLDRLQSMLALGTVHIQVKAGFGMERSIELSPAEMMVMMEMFDRFVAELPAAQEASKAN